MQCVRVGIRGKGGAWGRRARVGGSLWGEKGVAEVVEAGIEGKFVEFMLAVLGSAGCGNLEGAPASCPPDSSVRVNVSRQAR